VSTHQIWPCSSAPCTCMYLIDIRRGDEGLERAGVAGTFRSCKCTLHVWFNSVCASTCFWRDALLCFEGVKLQTVRSSQLLVCACTVPVQTATQMAPRCITRGKRPEGERRRGVSSVACIARTLQTCGVLRRPSSRSPCVSFLGATISHAYWCC